MTQQQTDNFALYIREMVVVAEEGCDRFNHSCTAKLKEGWFPYGHMQVATRVSARDGSQYTVFTQQFVKIDPTLVDMTKLALDVVKEQLQDAFQS